MQLPDRYKIIPIHRITRTFTALPHSPRCRVAAQKAGESDCIFADFLIYLVHDFHYIMLLFESLTVEHYFRGAFRQSESV